MPKRRLTLTIEFADNLDEIPDHKLELMMRFTFSAHESSIYTRELAYKFEEMIRGSYEYTMYSEFPDAKHVRERMTALKFRMFLPDMTIKDI